MIKKRRVQLKYDSFYPNLWENWIPNRSFFKKPFFSFLCTMRSSIVLFSENISLLKISFILKHIGLSLKQYQSLPLVSFFFHELIPCNYLSDIGLGTVGLYKIV